MTENKICTRCGYRRQELDSSVVSEDECPKCGIIYQKFETSMLAFDLVFSEKKIKRNKKKNDIKIGYMFLFLMIFSTLFFLGFISGRAWTKMEIMRSHQSIVMNR